MENKIQDLQASYLLELHTSKTQVSIYLKSGIRLKGYIEGVDDNTIFLKSGLSNQPCQLIYKHAIATIVAGGEQEMRAPF